MELDTVEEFDAATPGNWFAEAAAACVELEAEWWVLESVTEEFLAKFVGSLESLVLFLWDIVIMSLPDTGKFEFDFLSSSATVCSLEGSLKLM